MKRMVYYISDGTGITAETIGQSVLTQFDGIEFETRRIPFVDNAEKARAAAERVRREGEQSGLRPIIVNTAVDAELNAILSTSGALMMDVFAPFIVPLEQELGTKRQLRVGKAHGMVNYAEYEARINATNYTLTHDDGLDLNYSDADLILVGVSRSGKTPTCLYLALHFGIKAANYPLTPDDLERQEMPKTLVPHRAKMFALTIDPLRLQQVRQNRKPGSRYATIEQCRWEVAEAEKLIKRERLPVLSTTHTSIEEIASKVLQTLGINRHLL
jgi:[pyruvate, water dikinase]-phosphate phosphotransferase / [pyruvate, water dikinase] kinase